MRQTIRTLTALGALALSQGLFAEPRPAAKPVAVASETPGKLWTEPTDIVSRDLYYGSGGEKDAPRGTFTFEKEDLDGSNPKFVVHDQDGVKWKVKLGEEARPETVASRFVWATGYFADEDYFMADLRVEGMPAHLHRGRKQVGADGSMHNVRLKRYLKGEEKVGEWRWADSPYTGTRELNGLRVMMALINNWDLKDVNNTVYERKSERIYLVSDLGASFGSVGYKVNRAAAKGNLEAYRDSTFIRRLRAGYVDFAAPGRPTLEEIFVLPDFMRRVHMEWIGKQIPEADCKWVGGYLGQLSPEQIRAPFRAAGYTPEQVEAFARVVEERIAEINYL